ALATRSALGYAVESVQQNLNYTIQENVDASGAPVMGSFVITADDGSGSPSSALLAAIAGAVDVVRPLGSIYSVQPPGVLTANVTLTISVAAGVAKMQIVGTVASAVTAWINALPIGSALPLSRLAQLAYDSSPTVTNVSGITINGTAADLSANQAQIIK